MRLHLSSAIVFLTALANISPVSAAATGPTSPDALKAITDTAEMICGSIPTSGEAHSLKTTAAIQDQLNGLVKKLVSLGISGGIEFNSSSYVGVVQDALPEALKDTRNCKLHIFDVIMKGPGPTARLGEPTFSNNADGTYTELQSLDVSMASAGELRVTVQALELIEASVGKDAKSETLPNGVVHTMTGGGEFQNTTNGEDFFATSVVKSGRYTITVKTKSETPAKIKTDFD